MMLFYEKSHRFFAFTPYIYYKAPILQYSLHLFKVFDLHEAVHDHLHLATVVNAQFDGAVEDALVARYRDLVNVDVELARYDLRHIEEHTLAVDAVDLYCRIEEHAFVHVPFCIENAVAEACLQTVSHITVALVYLYALLVVEVTTIGV